MYLYSTWNVGTVRTQWVIESVTGVKKWEENVVCTHKGPTRVSMSDWAETLCSGPNGRTCSQTKSPKQFRRFISTRLGTPIWVSPPRGILEPRLRDEYLIDVKSYGRSLGGGRFWGKSLIASTVPLILLVHCPFTDKDVERIQSFPIVLRNEVVHPTLKSETFTKGLVCPFSSGWS